jgi:phosphoglycerate dehydrogenase-like enzyme
MKSAKAPKPSAADQAMITRQGMQLDEEMAKNEKRLKAVARGSLGSKSLLGTAKQAAAKQVTGANAKSSNKTGLPAQSSMNTNLRGYR